MHQRLHLTGGTLPILRGKRVEGQDLNLQLAASLDNFAHGFHPFTVAVDTFQATGTRPASIAIHDDGNMSGNDESVGQRNLPGFGLSHDWAQPPASDLAF